MSQHRKDANPARTLVRLIAGARIAGAAVLGAALVSAGAVSTDFASRSADTHHAQLHADATEAFLAHRYAAAYGRFVQLADEGHAPSALIALTMVRHGATLFGADWSARPEQMRRWSALAAQDLRANRALIADHARSE